MSEDETDYFHSKMCCPIWACNGDIRSKGGQFYCTECGFSFKGVEFKKEDKTNGES